jgi:hypothetical protein
LPGGWFRPRQVNVCDDTRRAELKYSGCFHLFSFEVRLTHDQYRINDLFIFESCPPLVAQLPQVALPGTSNQPSTSAS